MNVIPSTASYNNVECSIMLRWELHGGSSDEVIKKSGGVVLKCDQFKAGVGVFLKIVMSAT